MASIAGVEYKITPPKLKKWIELREVHSEIEKAIECRDGDGLADLLCSYVSIAFNIDDDLEYLPWKDIILAFVESLNITEIPNIPMLGVESDKENSVWDYEGRTWYEWAYVFSKEFSWSLEYIAELEVKDAIHLLQEILSNKQLNQEWDWLLSDRAFVYDSTAKKSKFNPLPRPPWMDDVPRDVEEVKVPPELLPVGNVINLMEKFNVEQ